MTNKINRTLIKVGSYTIHRENLIKYARTVIFKHFLDNSTEDLIKGSEYIITAQDVLKKCKYIPIRLLPGCDPTDCNTFVHHSIIKIVY